MTEKQSDEVRRSVREAYAAVADADDPSAIPLFAGVYTRPPLCANPIAFPGRSSIFV